MAKRLNRQSGFTLIELLIAIAILSLLMVTATSFYQFMSQNWARTKAGVDGIEQNYHDWMLVSEALTATLPKLIKREDGKAAFYFLGDQTGFTGFTSKSVQNPEYPAIYRFFREETESGKYQLVYEEAMLEGIIVKSIDKELPFNFRRVVWDGIENVSFVYTGWESFTQRLALSNIDQRFDAIFDFPVYDGAARRQHPLKITVRLDGFDWVIAIPDISSELISRTAEAG